MENTIQQSLSEEQIINQNYVAILEKTNQQLGLWSNPYGIMIGGLALLIAILAIAVSIYLWWNSSEQRKERKEEAANFFSNLEKIANKNIEEARKQYDELIAIQEKIIKSSTQNKKELEKELIELKKERASIGTNITSSLGTATVWSPAIDSLSGTTVSGTNIITGITGPLYTTSTRYGIGANSVYMSNSTSPSSLSNFCSKCKNLHSYNQKFCAECGNKL